MTRVAMLVALIPLTSLAQSSVTREQALGKQLAQDVESHSTIVTDPLIVPYVDRIAQRVARAANLPGPLTVKVISADSSFAFPGASCFLSTKLILSAASEAELAGAIAHLLGHVALWHDAHQADPQAIGQIPIVWAGDCQRLSGGGLAVPMGLAGRQAAFESRADQLGLGYMDKAGYDPGALADLFERMLSQPHKPSVFSPWTAFPASTRSQANALRTQGNNFVVTTSEFSAIQQRVSALSAAAAAPRPDAPALKREPMAPAVEHEFKLVGDPVIADYVNRIAGKLAASADLRIPLTVKVIEGDDARAITLPEGISYLTTRLLLIASNEAEFAGVIAHQLGHIEGVQGKASGSDGLCRRAAGSASLSADQLAAEERADLSGIEYMAKAGYDPGALADLYGRIFPSAGLAATRARAEALRNGRALVVTTSEFFEVRRRLTSLPH